MDGLRAVAGSIGVAIPWLVQEPLDRQQETTQPSTREPVVNWFERGGRAYAQYRPEYPDPLAEFLASLAPSADLAVDVGCGNGQLTTRLAPFFDQTIGIDPSASQLEHAQPGDRVSYLRAPAENLPVGEQRASLITAAQAAHWFDRAAFYAEVRRIAVDRAVLALVSYGVVELEPDLAERFHRFYHDEIGPYWPPERRLVDTGYADIEFPFDEHPAPPMRLTKQWTLDEFLGYLSTWSAVRRVDDAGNSEILRAFAADLAAVWGDPSTTRPIAWPVAMRLGSL
ncbi:class I SAM-dependent methyltransferase [Nocardia sp. NPDC058176]|uniref:class I SAM-dependent methyltransferase n=1 Tax=Nocardia sp. NPDC058176 TaxID=3346368 RepID=UPI0036DDEEBE